MKQEEEREACQKGKKERKSWEKGEFNWEGQKEKIIREGIRSKRNNRRK